MATRWRRLERSAVLALSLLVSGLMVAAVASPGQAQTNQVPDGGARPEAAGPIALPDGSPARPLSPQERLQGPLAPEIAEVELEIEQVTQQLQSILPDVGPAVSAVEYAEAQWQLAVQQRDNAQEVLDELVSASFRGAAALPPELFLPQLRSLSAHAPVPVDAPLGTETAARNLMRAQDAEQAAAAFMALAQDAEQTLSELRTQLEADLAALRDQRAELRARNAELLAEQERAREVTLQAQAAERFPQLQPVNGFEAHPDAVRAVQFAMTQLGKPYLWGAEGPDRYDCSGLVLASYLSVGVRLPRVAADQYLGTLDRLITRSAFMAQRGLLPGDLVFFSSGPVASSIHHVGIYVGGGQMIHAPNRNDVVKVSPVWWSRFFGATRVIPATPADPQSPSPSPSPSIPPSIPPTSPSPTPPGSPSPSPTPSPEPTTVEVPNLLGRTTGGAAGALSGAGLLGVEGNRVADCGEVAPGRIARQDPAPGARALVGSSVLYQVCELNVPPLSGLDEDDAVAALLALELVPVMVEVPSSLPFGRVVGTVPPVGTAVSIGDQISVQISDGSIVPELLGLSCEEATQRLGDRGLDWRFVEVTASDGDPGVVAHQQPEPGEPRPADDVVELHVHQPDDCPPGVDAGSDGGTGGALASAPPADARLVLI